MNIPMLSNGRRITGRLLTIFGLVAVSLAGISPATPALAATYDVDTAIDSAAAGYQACTAAANDCSLRGAIMKANDNAGHDTINVSLGTFLLDLGPLEIDSSLSLIGAGAGGTIIDGQDESRVIIVYGGNDPTVSIVDLTVRNGRGLESQEGGGVRVNSGAYVTIIRSIITDNGSLAPGGGLANGGTLVLIETSVHDNHVPYHLIYDTGGVQHSGGGITNFADATLRIIRSSITDNSATRGGGIRNLGGHIEVINSTVSGNYAYSRGGGIMNFGTAWITFSTITDNETDGFFEHADVYSGGGGIYNDPGSDPDPAPVDTARVSIANSIVAENRDNQLTSNDTHSPDCFSIEPSSFTSFRGNVIGIVRGSCNLADTIFGTDASFDQIGFFNFPLDPWLQPLAYNGASTLNHEIQQVSPALDRGDGVTSADFFDCPDTDQRGVPRPQGEECDAGSYEIEQYLVPLGLDYVLTPLPPERERVLVAVPGSPDFDPIQELDLFTIRFGATGQEDSLLLVADSSQPACTSQDANMDGFGDLVCKYSMQDTGFECGPNEAILRASFRRGCQLLTATGNIEIGPCR
jgi:hypothetical protein